GNGGSESSFGERFSDNYDMFIQGNTFPYTFIELVLPDGERVRFNRTSPGFTYSNAVFESASKQGQWYGAAIYWWQIYPYLNLPEVPGTSWILRKRDGTAYFFPDSQYSYNQLQQALIGIGDRYGNLLTITRNSSSQLV